ncbi:MAG: hypothetical protein L3J97_04190 [Thermoplasmata archaeon]|nr:hypothetical protein [Thermoplasmata archaeon]
MTGRESGRQARLGGLMLLGAALLATGAIGFEWRFAPGFLRHSLVEIPLVAAGLLLLLVAVIALALDRGASVPAAGGSTDPALASPESSLMALPAIVAEESAESSVPRTGPDYGTPTDAPPTPAPRPVGLMAEGSGSSTLLIPIADQQMSPTPAPAVLFPGQTVTRLVDRMESLQRVTPNGSPGSAIPSSSPSGPLTSPLLLRLTRIPSPPLATSALEAARRCSNCGDPLGSPPQFEACGDCGRALCEPCYWKTSSGPEAHLCATCVQERSVPRPSTPALSFPRPGVAASAAGPSGRTLPPRRRES